MQPWIPEALWETEFVCTHLKSEFQGAEWQKSSEEWDQEDIGMDMGKDMGKEGTSRFGQWYMCGTGNIL